MKFLRFLLVTVFCVCLVSCYEVYEEVVIHEDGSGTYITNMDLGQLVDMMQTFAGDEAMNKDGMDRVVDTVIKMSTVLDSAGKATPEQKELLKNGEMKLQMNLKEKLFKLGMTVPYKSFTDLQKLMGGESGSGAGLASVLKDMFGKGGEDQQQENGPDEPNMDEFSKIYTVSVSNGKISRILDTAKYQALKARPELAQMQQLTSSGMEILSTTTFKLPRPVKKTDNPLLKLSDDKKTVTLRYNMLEILDTPDKFSYTIEY